MNTNTALHLGLVVVSVAFAPLVHADLLPDPLGTLPKDASRTAKANVPTAASGTTNGVQPAPAPVPAAPVLTPAPTPTVQPAPSEVRPGVPMALAGVPQQAPVAPRAAVPERPTATITTRETFRQLDALRTRNAVLAEMVKGVELEAKLSPQSPANAPAAAAPSANVVQVLSVDGLDDDLTAVVALSNGTTIKARAGHPIPGMGKVKSITRDEVIVATKAGARSLDFAPIKPISGAR